MLRRTQPILNFARERPDLCVPAFFNPVVRGGSKNFTGKTRAPFQREAIDMIALLL